MKEDLTKKNNVGKLEVILSPSREISGKIAAEDVAFRINQLLEKKDKLRMIFAAAPSQNELLDELVGNKSIDWKRITAFHMDEYVGLAPNAPQAFGKFLDDRIFSRVEFENVFYIKPDINDLENTCKVYSELLAEAPIDIVCMGIGENGHIAFNDPPYADFNDNKYVKIVKLDEVSRQQQVNDGCFQSLDLVPKEAVTLTIPSLISADYLYVVVPGKTKANAVKETLYGPINENCPASILRRHENAKLYLDKDSASLLTDFN